MNRALKLADEKMFTTAYGMRESVKKILIILTDGREQEPQESNVYLKNIKDRGVEIISVAVGTEATINRTRLEELATNPGDVYVVSTYRSFKDRMEAIATAMCNSAGKYVFSWLSK